MQNDHPVSGLTFDVRDEFQRRPAAEKLIKLLTSDVDISPMVLDGQWGTGKTEFTHKTINLIDEKHGENYQTIYIDAFKADHTNDPLITLIAAVAQSLNNESEERASKLVSKAAPLMKAFMSIGSKVILNALVGRYAEEIPDSIENALKESATPLDEVITQLIIQQQKAEESLEKLKALLEEVACEKPLIIFVDELDRCRPDFAVNMLEVIKHVFDVPNIKFVLVCNLAQLERTINHQYGEGEAARKYLDKFIKFLIKIPDEAYSQNELKRASSDHAERLINKSEALKNAGLNVKVVYDFIDRIIVINDLSLREVETLIRHIEIIESVYPKRFFTLGRNLIPYISLGEALLATLGAYIHCFDSRLSGFLSKNEICKAAPLVLEIMGESKESIEKKLRGPSIDHPYEVIACALYSDISHPDDLEKLSNWNDYVKPRIFEYFRSSSSNRTISFVDFKYLSVIKETLDALRFSL